MSLQLLVGLVLTFLMITAIVVAAIWIHKNGPKKLAAKTINQELKQEQETQTPQEPLTKEQKLAQLQNLLNR